MISAYEYDICVHRLESRGLDGMCEDDAWKQLSPDLMENIPASWSLTNESDVAALGNTALI
jgi:hypothetical protein